jgi:tetratricopeptide (TPR) repeat protein
LPWVAGAVVLAAILTAAWWWNRPAIPRPELTGADPELIAAIDTAEQAVRRQPRSAEPWGELGLLLLSNTYWTEAEDCLRTAGELDAANWRWPYFQAACARWEAPERAIASLRISASKDPTAAAPRLLLGELLAMSGSAQEAQAHFEEVLSGDRQNARAQLGLARALVDQEKYEPAQAAAEQARSHPSARKAAAELLAQILQRLGQPAAAEEALAAAQRLPPDAPWRDDPLVSATEGRRVGKQAALNEVTTLRQAGAVERAQAVAEKTEQKHLDLYWLVEGRLRLQRGDASGAETALREALALDPGSLEILISLAQAQSQQQKTAEAEQTLHDLLAREPAYGPAWLELGRCLAKHDPPQALEALRSAVRYMPRSAAAHAELSAALAEQGEPEEAKRHKDLADELQRMAQPPAKP